MKIGKDNENAVGGIDYVIQQLRKLINIPVGDNGQGFHEPEVNE